MAEGKPKSVADLQPATIENAMHIAFSKIILQSAEIDHLVTLALFKICRLSFPTGFQLIGKTAISTKIKHLDFLINAVYDDSFCARYAILHENISLFGELRNAIDHGIFMGEHDGIFYISLYSNTSESNGQFVNKIMTLKRNEVLEGVVNAKHLIDELKSLFQLDLLHITNPSELHKDKPLTRRQAQKNKSARPSSPRGSSQA